MTATIHLIAPFHTVPAARYSHCAFTGKALRFPKMMRRFGYRVIEYSNEGSESEADEHVQILSRRELDYLYRPLGPTESFGVASVVGSPGWQAFDRRLGPELAKRIRPHDFIAHPFGRSHMWLVQLFPQCHHVETGIGYPDEPFGAWRIFESEAWRHVHWGRDGDKFPNDPGLSHNYSWVIPNYYDPEDWPIGNGAGHYVLFMGRIEWCKGLLVLGDLIREWDRDHPDDGLKFVFAGAGEIANLCDRCGPESSKKRVEYRGEVLGRARAKLTGDAVAMLMPTQFIEPFGGSGVESMLTGTPLIASDWGAFTETVVEGVTGFRCKTLNDWIVALERCLAGDIDRGTVADVARHRFTLDACGRLYDKALRQIADLDGAGWYARHPRTA